MVAGWMMYKLKYDLVLGLVKFFNLIMMTIPFGLCWKWFYEGNLAIRESRTESILITFIFMLAYAKDMGTPDRYYAACKDFAEGKIQGKNLRNKQKAIFLDRDGTINRYVGYLRKVEEFELLPGVGEAIRKINASGYLAIVVTNQPVIARGEVSLEELQIIHNKMETMLGKEGAYLDGIYYCPHHPSKGFEGEVQELKIDCQCRKPKPGMLLQAAKDFNIDLSDSWMIGDERRDIEAGKNAGCKTALIGSGEFGQDKSIQSLFNFACGELK